MSSIHVIIVIGKWFEHLALANTRFAWGKSAQNSEIIFIMCNHRQWAMNFLHDVCGSRLGVLGMIVCLSQYTLFIDSLWCNFSHNLVLFASLMCTYIPLHDRHRKHCYSYNRTCQPSSCSSYSSSHRRGSIHRQQCQHIPCQPQGHSELTVTHQPALLSLIYMYEMSAVH